MTRVSFAWRVLAALATLSVGTSLDSVNLDLHDLELIDLSGLGVESLDRYQASLDLTVDGACDYLLRLNFKKPHDELPGDAAQGTEFTGVCDPDTGSGNAPDGKPWHAHRRYWMRLPEYMERTTGFNHMSLYWRPCGLPPDGLRQPRYDINFYPIIPQYRAFWTCEEHLTPKECQYNQTHTFGRGHFTIPRLERDPNFLANMPVDFEPDPLEPHAYQYEGLFSYNPDLVPKNAIDWFLPQFEMSSYDGDVASWRALLPYHFFSGGNSTIFYEAQYYVHQTLLRLPASWNTTYNSANGAINLYLKGSAAMCGDQFDAAKTAYEEGS